MDFENTRFTKEHEWVRVDDSDVVEIGITDFAAGELGDIVLVEMPEVGSTVTKDEPMGEINAIKTVADLYAPVSGTVKEINTELEDNPQLVNDSPYGDGWFLKVELSDRGELDTLMNKAQYDDLVGRE